MTSLNWPMNTHSRTKYFLEAVLFGLSMVWTAATAHAWNATGHMTIASMTYDQLPPEARSQWGELLKSNPDYSRWQAAEPKDQPDFDEGRYLFMRAATWPDDIRKSGSPYEHSVWHYVDYPLVEPDFPLLPAPTDTEDLLSALAKCQGVVRDPQAPAVDRAAALSWLIHLVGDEQQPLHCAELVSPEYPLPVADRGGNLFWVSVGGAPVNLHWFWDCALGTSLDHRELITKGHELQVKFPREKLPELTQATDPKAWSLEGRALCLDVVYQRGELKGSTKQGPDDPALPEGYFAAAHAVAERRVVLAADRLADLLGGLAGGK